MKTMIALLALIPTLSFACPYLEGHYKKCHSEIKEMKGEYVIDQDTVKGTENYAIKYIDDDGSVQEDEFKTDGSTVTRKQKVPVIGIRVKVVGNAKCVDNSVVSKGKAYYLGAHVGSFDTKIYKTAEEVLTMEIDAEYLGKNVKKLIQCKEQ
jgi:hypothetical protein